MTEKLSPLNLIQGLDFGVKTRNDLSGLPFDLISLEPFFSRGETLCPKLLPFGEYLGENFKREVWEQTLPYKGGH